MHRLVSYLCDPVDLSQQGAPPASHKQGLKKGGLKDAGTNSTGQETTPVWSALIAVKEEN